MQQYPSINKEVIKDLDYYVFDKFGTRKKLMSDDSGILNLSKDLIMQNEKEVHDIFKKNKWQEGTLFFEFYPFEFNL